MGTLHGGERIGPQNPPRGVSKHKRKYPDGKGNKICSRFLEEVAVFFIRLWTPWCQGLILFNIESPGPRTALVHTELRLSIFKWAPLKHSIVYYIQKPILKDIDEFLIHNFFWVKGFFEVDRIQSIIKTINNLLYIHTHWI